MLQYFFVSNADLLKNIPRCGNPRVFPCLCRLPPHAVDVVGEEVAPRVPEQAALPVKVEVCLA